MTAQFRGLQKMEDFFKSLGKWRILISIVSLSATIAIYAVLTFLNI